MEGYSVLARALREQGVEYMFGVVGIPVIEIAAAAQAEGIKYIGMRNEQAASYAAGVVGYMTGRPGACLAVSGPGVIHAIAGLANAWSNCWPMVLIGGASDVAQDGMGAFQETRQIEACRPFVKYAARPSSVARIPFFVEQAVRMSMYGRPGATYIDMPGDLIRATADPDEIAFPSLCPPPPMTLACPVAVAHAMETLRTARKPLVIIGKGAAYARAEKELWALIERTELPFLPTPMGKGVLPDDHRMSVAAARSFALKNADVILLIGARLNWILHFGLPPRFRRDVKVIQVEICAEEIGTNVRPEVALVGHAKAVTQQLLEELARKPWRPSPDQAVWLRELRGKCEANKLVSEQLMMDDRVPMSYYRAFREIRAHLPPNAIIVGEGANTMDIGRTVMPNTHPRTRLDAGTYGTMGVGLGFAVAAALVHPDRPVVVVQGDSAFGFSGMELEVISRYKLNVKIIIVNNNGIYQGLDELPEDAALQAPPTSLMPYARYEKFAEAFGGVGLLARTPLELDAALGKAMASTVPVIVNVFVDPMGQRKPQQFDWLTRSKL